MRIVILIEEQRSKVEINSEYRLARLFDRGTILLDRLIILTQPCKLISSRYVLKHSIRKYFECVVVRLLFNLLFNSDRRISLLNGWRGYTGERSCVSG